MNRYLPLLGVLALVLCGCPNTDPVACSGDGDCAATKRCCAGVCKAVLVDVENCGACGVACPAVQGTASCESGACRIGCLVNRGNCDNDLLNGCEVDFTTDKKNCGSCAKACFATNASGVCQGSVCGQGLCNPGYADCDKQPATGCETNTEDDVANCGVCGFTCAVANGTPKCFSGTCQLGVCSAGFGNCDNDLDTGCEANLETEAQNCGECGTTCMGGETCVSGTCRKAGLILFGGALDPNQPPIASLVKFDPIAKTFEPILAATPDGAPEPRYAHLGVWDAPATRMIIYGGLTASQVPDPIVWALDFKTEPPTWTKVMATQPSPSGRVGMCHGHDVANRTLYVFGGQDDQGTDRNDFWKLDLSTGQWTLLHDDTMDPEFPLPLTGPSCAFLPETGVFVLFGGLDFNNSFATKNDTWTYGTKDLTPAWTQVKVANPPASRFYATMFAGQTPLALFGGGELDLFLGLQEVRNDVTVLDLAATPPTWTEETANLSPGVPSPRFLAAGAVAAGRRYLFGGSDLNGTVVFDDLWEFDPETKIWTELSLKGAATAPPGKAGASMVAPQ